MHKTLKFLLFLHLSLSFIACKSSKTMSDFTEDDVRFSLSKGVCFGSCPVFELKIYHGGYATFLGKQNTEKIGLYDKQLSKEDYKNLIKIFEKTNFDSFPAIFKSNIQDLPQIEIGYHNGKTFRIVAGKEDRPEDLMQAQFLLEKIADNKNWNFVKSEKELNPNIKAEPAFIYNEIIIEPKKGLLISKWIESQGKYGVRLVKKIAPALDYYLIAFDPKKIDPKEYIASLHKDKDIKSAEFNKKTTPR